MNKEKLIEYGFSEDQVKQLLRKKKLNTVHGTYTITGDELYLTSENNKKKIEI